MEITNRKETTFFVLHMSSRGNPLPIRGAHSFKCTDNTKKETMENMIPTKATL